jgi:hypothetical protein
MPEAYIRRGSALAPNQYNKPAANTIRVHSTTEELKFGTGASGTTEKTVVDTSTAQSLASKTLTDANGVNKLIINGTAKTIVDGSATSLFEVPVAAGAYVSGAILYTVFASDGTDHQAMSGLVTYSAVNKAATTTAAIGYATANDAKAVSSGTLTLSFTGVDSTNKLTVKLTPTGSLTETTYTVVYTVFPHIGAVTIL